MHGVLPSQVLRKLVRDGMISGPEAAPVEAGQVQPASLDLRLGTEALRLRASFLPGPGQAVRDRFADMVMHRMSLEGGAVLEKGCVYLVPLLERVTLPEGVSGAANAKSSTGRLDIMTRLIADGGIEFDRIPAGYDGPIYAEICPRSFSVLARPGMRLNQLRLWSGRHLLDDGELSAWHAGDPLTSGEPDIRDGLGFSVDLSEGQVIGYRARAHTGVIDLDRIGHYPRTAFWDPLHAEKGQLILDPGAFYILASREALRIPPGLAAEMAPYLAMIGEFRVHYAGFFDPGFGHAAASGSGARGVLEVRCHEAPFAIEHGQTVGRLLFERMADIPDILYGTSIASNYQGQGLKLSKHFT